MPDNGSCLTCMHFDRVFGACKYDFPQGISKKSAAARAARPAPRITPRTDVRTYKCGDYLSWETGLLPFSTPRREAEGATTGGAGGLPGQQTLL